MPLEKSRFSEYDISFFCCNFVNPDKGGAEERVKKIALFMMTASLAQAA
jgi:hypothetical protein